jgi:hypothetical protein
MGAPALAALQTYLARTIRRTGSLCEDPGVEVAEVDRIVTAGALGMTPLERLDVYREQFWFRHWESLAEDFPTLIWLLGGRPRFDALATEYLTAFPPSIWNLQRLGVGLPRQVATTPPWRNDPVLADAARLDWAYVQAFDTADATPFDVRTLAAAPDDALPRATIGFHPSLQVLALQHPVHVTRADIIHGRTPIRPASVPTFVAVWRNAAHHICEVGVEGDEFELWNALAAGQPLGEACEGLARRLAPEASSALESSVGRWFQEWAARGWVAAVAL